MFRYFCALIKLKFLLLFILLVCLASQPGFFGMALIFGGTGLVISLAIMAIGVTDGKQQKVTVETRLRVLIVIFNQTLDEIDALQKEYEKCDTYEQRIALGKKKNDLYKKLSNIREDANTLERECFIKNMELPVSARRHSIYKSVEDRIRWELKRKIQEAINLVLNL